MKRSRIYWAVIALALAYAAPVLHAVDGVVLIDQSRAIAGNVTPGDTPGYPIIISVPVWSGNWIC